MFERHGIPVMFAVIPFMTAGNIRDPASTGDVPLMPKKPKLLRHTMERGVMTVAQHPYSHRTVKQVAYSELVGVPLQEQRERIAKAAPHGALCHSLSCDLTPVTLFRLCAPGLAPPPLRR